MKTKIKVLKEIEIESIHIRVPVHYGEEDIPNDFPLRSGDMWAASVNIDTGKILGWPEGKTGDLCMKVCDEGAYTLYDKKGQVLATREQDYVPNGVVPGSCGDYVDLQINEHGVVTNWPKRPDVSAFFRNED